MGVSALEKGVYALERVGKLLLLVDAKLTSPPMQFCR